MKLDDIDFSRDSTETALKTVPFEGHLILFCCVAFLAFSILWATFATVDQLSRGQGQVVPSGNIQVVQNLEGGVVKEILVQEGDDVDKGQVLIVIDDTQASSSVAESTSKINSLKARIVRLIAESQDKPLAFPPDLVKAAPETVSAEISLYNSRKNELQVQVDMAKNEQLSKSQQLVEAKGQTEELQKNYELARKELSLNKPLLSQGAVSEVDILKLERSVNDAKGALENNLMTIPRLESDMNAAEQRTQETIIKFRTQAQDDYNQAVALFKQQADGSTALQDRLERTLVRSPVKGSVNQLYVHTVGGVVKPGEELVDVVPTEETLLITAKVKASDIAGLRPGLPVMVKLTAYDFSIYGGLKGTLEHVSANTVKSEDPRQADAFYEIQIRTNQSYLDYKGRKLPIKPGMAASVDIVTGKKTVLDYILKPILKAKQDALTER